MQSLRLSSRLTRANNETGAHRPAVVLGSPPERRGPLYGREADIEELRSLLPHSPLITIIGPGGLGKTQLAVEVGRASGAAFADGVYFVDAAAQTDAVGIAGRVLEVLHVQWRGHPIQELGRAVGNTG
jgi:hypothetical protein